MTPEELREIAASIAKSVGTEVGDRRAAGFSWSTKSSSADVVTEIDTWAEDEVVRRIEAIRPDDGFIGEEGTARSGTTGIVWVIDPVDGTTNLLYDIPGYSVSIGVERDGEAVAGAVHDPVRDELFSAAIGSGSTRNDVPISASTKVELETALVVTGFSYLAEHRLAQATALVHVLPHVRDIRRLGGAALDLCAVACGRVDAAFERGLQPWDSCAGALIASEAGAVVAKGIEPTDITVAAAPGIAEAFSALLDQAGA